MGWRGPATVAALALLGVAAGYGASLASSPSSVGSGVAAPVVVEGAPLPVGPETAPSSDPTDPALEPGVLLERVTLGAGRFAISFPVPVGWTRSQSVANEAKWKRPRTSNNTYVLRVEQLTSRGLSIAEAKAAAMERLADEQDDVDFRPSGPDSLDYTYTSDEGTRRHSFIRWVDVFGRDLADAEVVVHGRERDVAGTSDLVLRVAAGMTAT